MGTPSSAMPRLSGRWRAAVRHVLIFVAVSVVAGLLYGMLRSPDIAMGATVGAWNGLLISVPIVLTEQFFESRHGQRLQRQPVPVVVAIRSALYLLFILAGLHVGPMLAGLGTDERFADTQIDLRDVAFSLAMALALTSILQVNRMLGPGVLAAFVTTRYFRPREQERVFLFLDLADSTSTAARIGNLRFLGLLNDLVFDVTNPVLDHRGTIHRYVGDGIIVTWPAAAGLAHAACVRCYFAVVDRLAARADHYRRRYGLAPRFRAALHVGIVVVGELGDVRREIVYLGDTMNMTARLEAATRDLGRDLLLSADLVGRLPPAGDLDVLPLGGIAIRGRDRPLDVYTVERR